MSGVIVRSVDYDVINVKHQVMDTFFLDKEQTKRWPKNTRKKVSHSVKKGAEQRPLHSAVVLRETKTHQDCANPFVHHAFVSYLCSFFPCRLVCPVVGCVYSVDSFGFSSPCEPVNVNQNVSDKDLHLPLCGKKQHASLCLFVF